MLIVITIAGAAALTVVAYSRLRQQDADAGTAGLRAVRELAAIVLVCVKAVEGVVDVLSGSHRLQAATSTSWGYRSPYTPGYDDYEDER